MAARSLPPEIIHAILDCFSGDPYDPDVSPRQSIAHYAAVCKNWANAVERITFRELHLTPSRLGEFERLIRGRRQAILHAIDFNIELDTYDSAACSRRETEQDQLQNNNSFTLALQTLCKTMSLWQTDEASNIALSIKAYSPSDLRHSSDAAERLNRPEDIGEKRFERSVLRFDSESNPNLASVKSITELHVDANPPRRISPTSISKIAASLPNLQTFVAECEESERWLAERRMQARNEFAQSLEKWPDKITYFNLAYVFPEPDDQYYSVPSLVTDENPHDLFSHNLSKLSVHLTSLHLGRGTVLDISTFEQAVTKGWPSLETVTLQLSPISATGEWYFERDEDAEESGDDNDSATTDDILEYTRHEDLPAPMDRHRRRFRSAPQLQMLEDFYVAAAHAVQRMPRIKFFSVTLEVSPPGIEYTPSHMFEFNARDPDSPVFPVGSADGSIAATWTCVPLFEPPEHVLKLWRDVAEGLEREITLDFVLGDGAAF